MNLDKLLAGLLADLDETAREQRDADRAAELAGWRTPADRHEQQQGPNGNADRHPPLWN